MGIFAAMLDLMFPPKCAFCRKILSDGEKGMCAKCEKELRRTSDGGKQTGDYYSVCVSPLYYEDTVRESLLRFKFSDITAYADVYGKLIAGCIRENLAGKYDLISWVPLSAKRLRARGYDQAMLIAMSAALDLQDVAVSTLEKIHDVPAQSGMGSEEKRKANISGAYRCADEELVAGKRILLIDDIITTGSTLSECAKTLLISGAEEILCATLARSVD